MKAKTRREEMEEWLKEPPPFNFKGPKLVVKDGRIVCDSTYIKVTRDDPNWSERYRGGIWLGSGRRIW